MSSKHGNTESIEDTKPPAKRNKLREDADSLRDKMESRLGAATSAAHITVLDSNMQRSISLYMDILDWGNLRHTSKLLRSWPKPSPPKIDYHLIRFCMSNTFHEAHCGVAKTLNGVKGAFKYLVNKEKEYDDPRPVDTVYLQFIRLIDSEACKIPLIQFYVSEDNQKCDTEKLSWLHPNGGCQYGVIKNVLSGNWGKSVSGRWLDWSITTSTSPEFRADSTEVGRWHDGLVFDDEQDIAPFVWFDGIQPQQDVDLERLGCKKGKEWRSYSDDWNDNWHDGCDRNEIWLFKTKPSLPGKQFTISPDGTWALCDNTVTRWDIPSMGM